MLMPTTEGQVKKPVCDYAESQGLIVIQMRVLGVVGFPDTIILGPNTRILFIEFKRPGKEPRKIQGWWHRRLERYGFHVRVVNDEEKGKRIIKGIFRL